MKYKLKVSMAGPKVDFNVGDMVELNEYQAQRYADAGYIDMPTSTIKSVEKPKKGTAPKKGKPKKTKV